MRRRGHVGDEVVEHAPSGKARGENMSEKSELEEVKDQRHHGGDIGADMLRLGRPSALMSRRWDDMFAAEPLEKRGKAWALDLSDGEDQCPHPRRGDGKHRIPAHHRCGRIPPRFLATNEPCQASATITTTRTADTGLASRSATIACTWTDGAIGSDAHKSSRRHESLHGCVCLVCWLTVLWRRFSKRRDAAPVCASLPLARASCWPDI